MHTWLLGVLLTQAIASDQASRPAIVDHWLNQIEAAQNRVASIEFLAEAECRTLVSGTSTQPGSVHPYRWLRLHYRASGRMVYFRQQEGPAPSEIEMDNTWAFDGARTYHYSILDWGGYIEPAVETGYSATPLIYLSACHLIPPHIRATGAAWPSIRANRERASFSNVTTPGLSAVKVSVYGHSTYFFDPLRDFAVLRIERRQPEAELTIVNDDFVSTASGAWLPLVVTRDQRTPGTHTHWIIRVFHVETDRADWAPESFAISYPPRANIAPPSASALAAAGMPVAKLTGEAFLNAVLEIERSERRYYERFGRSTTVPECTGDASGPVTRNAAQSPEIDNTPLSCGASSAYALMRLLAKPMTYKEVAAKLHTGDDHATTFRLIARLLHDYGIHSDLTMLNIHSLAELRKPAVLGLSLPERTADEFHFVAYLGMRDNRFVLCDGTGSVPLRLADAQWLSARWRGEALIADFTAERPAGPARQRYWIGLAGLLLMTWLGWRHSRFRRKFV